PNSQQPLLLGFLVVVVVVVVCSCCCFVCCCCCRCCYLFLLLLWVSCLRCPSRAMNNSLSLSRFSLARINSLSSEHKEHTNKKHNSLSLSRMPDEVLVLILEAHESPSSFRSVAPRCRAVVESLFEIRHVRPPTGKVFARVSKRLRCRGVEASLLPQPTVLSWRTCPFAFMMLHCASSAKVAADLGSGSGSSGGPMQTLVALSGTVKSWNEAEGFGFITASGLSQDVLFGRTELRDDVREIQGKFMEDRPVIFDASLGPDGRYRATVVSVSFDTSKEVVGWIKTFSERHGYGFITSSSLTQDVRFQTADLPPGVIPHKGEPVTFDVRVLPDGRLRVSKLRLKEVRLVPIQGPRMGTVKSYSEENGCGFLCAAGVLEDIKFGRNDLADGPVEPGDVVSFSEVRSQGDRLQASNVRRLENRKRSAVEAQLEEDCQFYRRAGWCQYGEHCRYAHVRRWNTPVLARLEEDCQFFKMAGWCKYGTPKELPKELDEIQGKLGQLCVVKATGGRVAKFGKIKLVRKRFARNLIVDCQKQKESRDQEQTGQDLPGSEEERKKESGESRDPEQTGRDLPESQDEEPVESEEEEFWMQPGFQNEFQRLVEVYGEHDSQADPEEGFGPSKPGSNPQEARAEVWQCISRGEAMLPRSLDRDERYRMQQLTALMPCQQLMTLRPRPREDRRRDEEAAPLQSRNQRHGARVCIDYWDDDHPIPRLGERTEKKRWLQQEEVESEDFMVEDTDEDAGGQGEQDAEAANSAGVHVSDMPGTEGLQTPSGEVDGRHSRKGVSFRLSSASWQPFARDLLVMEDPRGEVAGATQVQSRDLTAARKVRRNITTTWEDTDEEIEELPCRNVVSPGHSEGGAVRLGEVCQAGPGAFMGAREYLALFAMMSKTKMEQQSAEQEAGTGPVAPAQPEVPMRVDLDGTVLQVDQPLGTEAEAPTGAMAEAPPEAVREEPRNTKTPSASAKMRLGFVGKIAVGVAALAAQAGGTSSHSESFLGSSMPKTFSHESHWAHRNNEDESEGKKEEQEEKNEMAQLDREAFEAEVNAIPDDIERLQKEQGPFQDEISGRSDGKEEFHAEKTELRAQLDELSHELNELQAKKDEINPGLGNEKEEAKAIKEGLGYMDEKEVDAAIKWKMSAALFFLEDQKERSKEILMIRGSRPKVSQVKPMEAQAAFSDLGMPARDQLSVVFKEMSKYREANKKVQKEGNLNGRLSKQPQARHEKMAQERQLRCMECDRRGEQRQTEKWDQHPPVSEMTLTQQSIAFCKALVATRAGRKKEEKKDAPYNNEDGEEMLLRKQDCKEEFFAVPTKGKKAKAHAKRKNVGKEEKVKSIRRNDETFIPFGKLSPKAPIIKADEPISEEKPEAQNEESKVKVVERKKKRKDSKKANNRRRLLYSQKHGKNKVEEPHEAKMAIEEEKQTDAEERQRERRRRNANEDERTSGQPTAPEEEKMLILVPVLLIPVPVLLILVPVMLILVLVLAAMLWMMAWEVIKSRSVNSTTMVTPVTSHDSAVEPVVGERVDMGVVPCRDCEDLLSIISMLDDRVERLEQEKAWMIQAMREQVLRGSLQRSPRRRQPGSDAGPLAAQPNEDAAMGAVDGGLELPADEEGATCPSIVLNPRG
ncbi:unnamed protein product, partial [Polarella glacialis]